MPDDHRFSCIATIKNEMKFTVHGGTKIQIFLFLLSSVGSVKFLFCFFCLLFFFFHKFTLSIGEMNKIPNQTEFLVFNCRYLVFFSIQNTNVSVVSVFQISYQISVRRERERERQRGGNEENNQ